MASPKSRYVARVGDWEFAGTTYSVHVGRVSSLGGRVSILAVGPSGEYRSVVLSADQAAGALTDLLGVWNTYERTRRAESLLGPEQDAALQVVH